MTAQKRSEDVNKVPISVAVFDQKSMDIQGVRDIADIANLTPGVQYINTGVVNQLSIRGISSTMGSPTTATYIDDVPVGGRTGQIGNVGSSPPSGPKAFR
jgi:outer membrane receptor for ferrienterochelin and colicin